MMGKLVVILLLIGAVLVTTWQLFLGFQLSHNQISCGGDWSYNVSCPLGSYCKSLNEGPLAGGVCTPYQLFR